MGILPKLELVLGRRFLSGGVWAVGGKLLSSTTNVLVVGILARLLTVKEMGAYFLLFSFASAGAVCAQLGLDQTVVRLVASSMATGKPGRARATANGVLGWGIFGSLGVAGILATGLGRWLAELLFHSPLITSAMSLVPAWVAFAALQNLIAETFRGFHDIRFASFFSRGAFNVICFVLLSLLWVWRHHASLLDATAIVVLSGGMTVLIAGYTLQRQLKNLGPSDSTSSHPVLRAALPQLVTNLTLIINSQAALWILGTSRPPEEAALFGAAARLVVLVNLPIVIANSVVAPMIAELYAQKKQAQLEATLRTVATVAALPSLAALAAYFVFGKLVLGFAYGPYYQQGAIVLAVLSLGQLANVWSGSCGLTLVMSGHYKTMMRLTLACGVFNALGAWFLVRQYGALGAAAAGAATTVLQNLLMLIFVKRKTGVWTHAHFSMVSKHVFAR